MSTENALTKYLKSKRESAGLSQRDVSNELGYDTPQFISNWERGVSHPPIESLKKLAVIYKVDAQEIFEVQLATTLQEVKKDLRRKFDMACGLKSKTTSASKSWRQSESTQRSNAH